MFPPLEADHHPNQPNKVRPFERVPPPVREEIPDWEAGRVRTTSTNGKPLEVIIPTLEISPTRVILLPETGAPLDEESSNTPSASEIMTPKLKAAQEAFVTPHTGKITKGDYIQTNTQPKENEKDIIYRVIPNPLGTQWPQDVDLANPDYNFDNTDPAPLLWQRDNTQQPIELPPIDENGKYYTSDLPIHPDELVMLSRVRISTDEKGNPVYTIISAQLNTFVFPVGEPDSPNVARPDLGPPEPDRWPNLPGGNQTSSRLRYQTITFGSLVQPVPHGQWEQAGRPFKVMPKFNRQPNLASQLPRANRQHLTT